jgi:hypothetical protein
MWQGKYDDFDDCCKPFTGLLFKGFCMPFHPECKRAKRVKNSLAEL